MVLNEKKAGGLMGLLAIVSGVAAIITARSFPPSLTDTDVGPSIFPTAYGAVLAILGLLLFARGLRRSFAPASTDNKDEQRLDLAKLALGLVGVTAYLWVIDYAGFAISTVIYLWLMIGLMRGPTGYRKISTVVLAVLIGLAVYAAFVTLLQVPLPTGLWLDGEA